MTIKDLLIQPKNSAIRRTLKQSAGFTILELMIASTVFAVVLLIVAIGAISFTNSYYSGITSSNVQSVARSIMSEISQSVEFSKNLYTLSPSAGVAGYCIDNTMFSYELGLEVVNPPTTSQDQNYHALVINSNSSCSSNSTPSLPEAAPGGLPPYSHELLNQHMRLGAFDITPLSGNLYSIHIRVIYGDNVILKPASLPSLGNSQWDNEGCNSGAGSQFCAVSDLTTTVEQRLN